MQYGFYHFRSYVSFKGSNLLSISNTIDSISLFINKNIWTFESKTKIEVIKFRFGHIFYVVRGWSERPPLHKNIFSSSNGLEITLECLICVQQGLFLSWDQYLVYFEPLGSLQTQRKNFLTKCQKSPPSKTKKISPKNVYVISWGCLKNVQRCLFLLWD